MADEPSIFTRIINGEVPGEFVYKDDQVVAIRDIHPIAPFHVLIIPREPLENVYAVREEHEALMGHMMLVAARIAQQEQLEDGFRLVINNGANANQEVFHLHMHMIGGRKLKGLG